MNKEQNQLYFMLGAALLIVFLANALYFAMPYAHLNPYEFFQNAELSHFQFLNLLIGGVGIPLIAVIAGSLMYSMRHAGTSSIVMTLIIVLIIGVIQSIFVFGYDFLALLSLSLLIGCFFLRVNRWITLVSFAVLMMIHMMLNGFLELVLISGLEDQIYTNIQEVNSFSSVYRSSDYMAVVTTNLEVFLNHSVTGGYENLIMILPYVMLGIVFSQFNVIKYIKENTGMMIFLALVILGGGVTIKLLQIISLGSGSVFTVSEVIGGGLFAVGMYLILLMSGLFLPEKISVLFQNTGRKALTAYILFNIIMMVIFYGIGFSMYGERSILEITGYVLLSYTGIVILMNILSYFKVKSIEESVRIDRRK